MTLLDEESSMLSLQGLKEREKPRLRLTRGEGRMVILLRWMVLGKIVVEREIAMDAQKHVMTIVGYWERVETFFFAVFHFFTCDPIGPGFANLAAIHYFSYDCFSKMKSENRQVSSYSEFIYLFNS